MNILSNDNPEKKVSFVFCLWLFVKIGSLLSRFGLSVIVLVMMMKMLVMMMESPGKRPETKLKKVSKILKESAANIQCRAVTLLLRQRWLDDKIAWWQQDYRMTRWQNVNEPCFSLYHFQWVFFGNLMTWFIVDFFRLSDWPMVIDCTLVWTV